MKKHTWSAQKTPHIRAAVSAAIIGIFIYSCSSASFFVWEQDLIGRIGELEDLNEPFTIVVERDYENQEQEELLAIAEATYPLWNGSIIIPKTTRPHRNEEARWWSSSFDGIKIPLAITKSAVEYYVALIHNFKHGDFSTTPGIVQRSAEFRYHSYIEPAEDALEGGEGLSDLFLVRVELSWSSNCGTLCGLFFDRSRVLVIHKSGRVIELIEDPLQKTSVS